jgi:putative transcriptional regulator
LNHRFFHYFCRFEVIRSVSSAVRSNNETDAQALIEGQTFVNERVIIQGQTEAMDQMLAEFSNGSLPLPLHVLMASHLELSSKNRNYVSSLESALAQEMNAVEPGTVRHRSDRLNAIFADALPLKAAEPIIGDILPSSLATYLGKPLEDVHWKTKLMGIKEAHIETVNGVEASLLWVKAGRKMPSHTHEGSEVTLVLSGSFSDMMGVYRRGDVAVADANVDHRPMINADADCVCFVVTDAPLRLTGPVGKLFNRFFKH